MGSTFCGRAENLTISNPSLTPVLRKTGFRERDENQSVLLALALGGGTASGASHVVLERARALNSGCLIMCFYYAISYRFGSLSDQRVLWTFTITPIQQ